MSATHCSTRPRRAFSELTFQVANLVMSGWPPPSSSGSVVCSSPALPWRSSPPSPAWRQRRPWPSPSWPAALLAAFAAPAAFLRRRLLGGSGRRRRRRCRLGRFGRRLGRGRLPRPRPLCGRRRLGLFGGDARHWAQPRRAARDRRCAAPGRSCRPPASPPRPASSPRGRSAAAGCPSAATARSRGRRRSSRRRRATSTTRRRPLTLLPTGWCWMKSRNGSNSLTGAPRGDARCGLRRRPWRHRAFAGARLRLRRRHDARRW